MDKHIGSTLNSYLAEEDLLAESELLAVKRVIACHVEQAMCEKNMNKTKMAAKMGTSRAALKRLLDPDNTAITLHTLEKAARAVGKTLHVGLD